MTSLFALAVATISYVVMRWSGQRLTLSKDGSSSSLHLAPHLLIGLILLTFLQVSLVACRYYTELRATNATWPQAEQLSAIVCETYLGTPLSGLPSPTKLDEIIDEANEIASGFLKNIAPQIAPKTRLCVALPAWNMGNEKYKHLKVLDSLEKLGYNRVEFVHANEFELIYHRPDQIVARQLTILEKK